MIFVVYHETLFTLNTTRNIYITAEGNGRSEGDVGSRDGLNAGGKSDMT